MDKPLYTALPYDIDGFGTLAELSLDMRWSWNHATDEIWSKLDPELWNLTHNPRVVLQTVSRDRFLSVMKDPLYRKKIDALLSKRKESNIAPAWFQQNYPETKLKSVVYFSMEFMLSEALPIYSGGLGNVAGDQLKTASDLGIPVTGVGLLYQQGYFRQEIDRDGAQQAFYPYNDPGQLPITPMRQANGEWLRLEISLPGTSLWLRTWKVQVGRINLYLLDSNDPANFPVHRGITSELYGGGTELRLKQELVLGIGGWRLLRALDIQPQVCHLNEGHAAFAILERALGFMKDTGQPFDVALTATRAGNLFTTHTAVTAGFDCFPPQLIEQYLGEYAKTKLGIELHQLLALGRKDKWNASENFNMAYLAIRGSGAINGVSRLHGEVSRHLFEPLFPKWPTHEIPVSHITNGIHVPTWDSREADDIWTQACGKNRWLGTNKTLEQDIRKVTDEKLWEMRSNANKTLILFAREHLKRQLIGSGRTPQSIESASHLFDPDILTLGFARRFATYKRPDLLLHDPQRLLKILTNPKFRVQLVIAGKAHPADLAGQKLIQEWMDFIRKNVVHPPVVFLGDYDLYVSENLVQGVDVWINTPRRPWEASGTSGMKVLVNGGINLSILDGWWAEAYSPKVGWALGDGFEHGDDPFWDAKEADQLYNILEQEVIPEFYNRNEKGIPTAWISRMRESMALLTPQFSADRSIREYTEQHYMPAAKAYMERTANKGKLAVQIRDQLKTLNEKWDTLHFGEVNVTINDNQYNFKIQVYLNNLDPETVQVEIYANAVNGQDTFIQKMTCSVKPEGISNSFYYETSVTSTRPVTDFTARIIPCIPDIEIPLENTKILWQK